MEAWTLSSLTSSSQSAFCTVHFPKTSHMVVVLNIPDEATNHKMYVLNNLVALYNNFTPLSIVKSLVSA